MMIGEELVHSRKIGLQGRVQARFLHGQLVRQEFEDFVRCGSRLAVPALDARPQCRDLVIQLDGEVERVLAAAVADLVDLLLDRAELAAEAVESSHQGSVLILLQPVVHLLFQFAHQNHDFVRVGHPVADLHGERELLREIGDGDVVEAGILFDLELVGERLAVGRETRLGSSELAQIGYVSENQKLPGWMTLEQLLQFCKPLYPTWDGLLGEKLVRQFDLPPGRKIRTLSRGQRIKAAMVTALAYRPRLLVLDEPFSGLDVAVREELVQGMLELAGQGDWTLFISSHDLEDIENLVDWVGFINEGRLLFSEELERLQARFREVEVTLPEAAAAATNLPRSWGPLQVAGKVLRFIETQYQEGESEAHIRRIFPTAENLFISPLSLRSIFVTLARQSKGSSREEKTL